MKNFSSAIVFLGLILFSSNASAWIFFLLPGAVTSKIGDVLTGSEGNNCVGPNARVGDQIYANGTLMTIKSLSGTTSRCNEPATPIRASLVPVTSPAPAAPIVSAPWLKENTAEANRDVEARNKSKDDETKKLAEIEVIRTREEEAKRFNAESEAKKTVALTPHVDFNAEVIKASRILGCSASEIKVVGVEKENIMYSIGCSDSKRLQLSCDPSGLCLQKKSGS